jgi:hypothetical protein
LEAIWNVSRPSQLVLVLARAIHDMLLTSSCAPGPKLAALVLSLLPLVLIPDDLAAQGQPVEMGSHIPVALWFIGAGVLGLVIAYGLLRNRSRATAEKQITEEATKHVYAEEERERIRSGGD